MIDQMIHVACPLCDGDDQAFERTVRGFQLVRCRNCSFVFVNPRYSDAALDEIYTSKESDAHTDLYSRIATPGLIAAYNLILDRLERLLPGRGKLLDVGCGAGYFFEQAQQRGWDAHGVDLGGWAADAAKARGLRNLHTGRLVDLGFPDRHFDVIFSAQMFEHLPEPRKELADMQRLLRADGLLYLDVPNYHTLPILLGRDDFMLNTPPQHLNYFTPRTLMKLLESSGWRSVQVATSDGLKWQNIFGRPIRSEIASAYGLGAAPRETVSDSDRPALSRTILNGIKATVRTTVVQPLFYRSLQVGMLLSATARCP